MIDAKTALNQLAQDIKKEIIDRMRRYGMNRRAVKNTLIGSDLEKSVEVKVVSDEALVFYIADYYEYVVRGWSRTGRYPGTMRLFVENITQWVRKKGIRFGNKTENQVVWAIIKSIWMRGIEARPFLHWDDSEDPAIIIPFLDDYFDKWSDLVWNQIIEELDKYFTK